MPCIPGMGVVCDAVEDAAIEAADEALDSFVGKLAEGFGEAVAVVMTFWTGVTAPRLDDTAGPVGVIREDLLWLTLSIAVTATLWGAARLAITSRGDAAVDIGKGLAALAATSFIGVPAIAALTFASDIFAWWIIDRSSGGDFGGRLLLIDLRIGAGIGTGLLMILAVVGMIGSVVQAVCMFVRIAVLTLLAGALPTLAAASMTRKGKATFEKAVAWVVAFILFKPVAALIYAGSFGLIGQGQSATEVIAGITMMCLAPIALPALMRLVTPAVNGAVAAGSGGAGAATLGALASGAMYVNRAGPRTSGGGSGGGVGAGAAKAGGGVGAGPSGAMSAGSRALPMVGVAAAGASAAASSVRGVKGSVPTGASEESA